MLKQSLRRNKVTRFNGKGSRPRPYNRDKFNESFDRIFKNKNKPITELKNVTEEKKEKKKWKE